MAGYHSVNRVILIGRVGKIGKKTPLPGTTRCYLIIQLITEEVFKGGKKRKDWHRIHIFGPDTNFVEKYLTVGSLLAVEGSLRTSFKSDRTVPEKKSVARMVNVEAQKLCVLVYKKAEEEKPEPAPAEVAKTESQEE